MAATIWRGNESAWRALVDRSLRGNALDTSATYTDDGLALGPIHRPDKKGRHIVRDHALRPWLIVQRADDPDEDRVMENFGADIAGGATAIEFVFAGSASAERTGFALGPAGLKLLSEFPGTSGVRVRLDAGAASLLHYHRLDKATLAGLDLSFDPLAEAAARGGFDRPQADIEQQLIGAAIDFRERGLVGRPVAADGRVWAAGGASEAQEIAGILGSMVHSLRLLVDGGLSLQNSLDAVGLIADAGPNQLLTMAKLRALRLCHARVAEAFGCAPLAANIHAETSWRMMTRDDVHTNILRSTSAAFAAGVGGADSITILPCNIAAGVPDGLARRIARNTQVILLEESTLAGVVDPGAGAGAVEALTGSLAEAAWNAFRKLEAGGGLAAALRAGSFQGDIAKTRDQRAVKVARRQIPVTGVSTFSTTETADSGAIVPPPRQTAAPRMVEEIPALPPSRLSEPFEVLRDRAAALAGAGRPAKVFLANLGTEADYSEPARFATHLFAAGGVPTIDAGGFTTPMAAADAFIGSGAKVACITGSTETKRQHASATAEALRRSGAAQVYIVGDSNSDAAATALTAETDVVTILSQLLDPSG